MKTQKEKYTRTYKISFNEHYADDYLDELIELTDLEENDINYVDSFISESNTTFDNYQFTYCITIKSENCQKFISDNKYKAQLLYSLYSAHYLIIEGHEFPKYQNWKDYMKSKGWNSRELGTLTLDHKLPREYFPELTFDVDNWQGMEKGDNKEKASKIMKEDLNQRIQIKLSKSFETSKKKAIKKLTSNINW